MYAEILLTQKLGPNINTLTYRVPDSLAEKLQKGNIVEIGIRKKKTRGVVASLHEHTPAYETKEILEIVQKAAHLHPWQIELLFWMSDYYFCPPHKILKLFFPNAISQKKKLPQWQAHEEKTTCQNQATEQRFLFHGTEQRFLFHTLILTTEQQQAFETITEQKSSPPTKKTILLHGITGSGKTEIYRRLAEHQIQQNRQILILVPEISLTPQTFQNFQEEFGDAIAVLHSHLTAKSKEKYWYDIYHGEAKIIIGSRSALFAPFANLGMIVMDEEHEFSYKQDQSPRYHARDVAIKMAELLGIKCVLGSATPSLETYYNATQGHYGLATMKKRIQQQKSDIVALPAVTIVDLREEIRKKNFSIFSELLIQKIKEKLDKHEQIILFLNRRGAAGGVVCRESRKGEKCDRCDVAKTYNKHITVERIILPAARLICHHCGSIKNVPVLCPKCGSAFIRYIGLGTQRIEEEIKKIFPAARVLRADKDTTSQKGSFEKFYNAFKNHEADILIGTQMIGKGLHLPQVSLVGVILADLSLTIPDFRSAERTFQILTQVAGRAGREAKKGEVIIQTYLPENYAIMASVEHDYIRFFEEEMKVRKAFAYPPLNKLIKLTFIDKDAKKCLEKAKNMMDILNVTIQKMADPPADVEKSAVTSITNYPALITKVQDQYRWHILITGQNPSLLLKNIPENGQKLLHDPHVRIDIDPISVV